jgi:AAHS family 4-hydroxybenzoate transporter-like MFS transporter
LSEVRQPSKTAPHIELASVIDSARFMGIPCFVAVLTFVIMTIDGFDLQAMGFVAPALATVWHVKRELLGPVLAASVAGMAVGSVALGGLGDRVGRKWALGACFASLCLGSLLSANATSLSQLVIFRVLTGLGLGGATPLATSLIVEWMPRRLRNVALAVVIVGIPMGGTLGSGIAARLIPVFGWQSVFYLGAVMPLILLLLIAFALPESPKYLAESGNQSVRLAKLLNRLVHAERFTGNEIFVVETGPRQTLRWTAILCDPALRRSTWLIWAAFVCNSLALYSFVNWLPTVLTAAGMSLEHALRGSMLFNFGGVVGAVGGATLIGRYGSRRVGTGIAITGAIAAAAVGFTVMAGGSGAQGWLLAWVVMAGFSFNGMQNFLYAVAANAYPTRIRGSGVGWASAVARAGGVLSSVVGSAVFSLGLSAPQFFYVIAAIVVLTTVSFAKVPLHIPRRSVVSLAPLLQSED